MGGGSRCWVGCWTLQQSARRTLEACRGWAACPAGASVGAWQPPQQPEHVLLVPPPTAGLAHPARPALVQWRCSRGGGWTRVGSRMTTASWCKAARRVPLGCTLRPNVLLLWMCMRWVPAGCASQAALMRSPPPAPPQVRTAYVTVDSQGREEVTAGLKELKVRAWVGGPALPEWLPAAANTATLRGLTEGSSLACSTSHCAQVLKTTQSGYAGFQRDQFTTLPDVRGGAGGRCVVGGAQGPQASERAGSWQRCLAEGCCWLGSEGPAQPWQACRLGPSQRWPAAPNPLGRTAPPRR